MSKKTKKTLNTLKAKRSQYRAGGIGRTEAAKEAGRSGRNPVSDERNLLQKAKDKVVNEMTKNKGGKRKPNKSMPPVKNEVGSLSVFLICNWELAS